MDSVWGCFRDGLDGYASFFLLDKYTNYIVGLGFGVIFFIDWTKSDLLFIIF